jgi:hypothetical protein
MRLLAISVMMLCLITVACNKKETLSFAALTEYYPLQVGKTFTYRLDSILPINFGTSLQTKHYLAKDSIESQFSDAQGRPSFRIWRFVRDTLATQPWRYTSTYVATIDNNQKWIEYVDNNLRFIALRQPITEGFSWKGNSFIDTRSGGSPVQFMDDWDYTYQDIDQSYTVRKGKFDSTISVLHVDEVTPPGPFNPCYYQQTNYSIEVYAKGVGLIYKEFLHKIWNLASSNCSGGSWDDSYGVKLNLVDYK